MSNEIEQKVLSMQFDNKQFESGVQTTLGTLEKLKQSLNLTGATKGLENVQSAANRCDMTGLGSAVETIRTKFSALEVMGVTALANITNSAVNAGKRLAASFTIEPIKTGLAEYETQIGAVQTILANTKSKGTNLDDVNGALDELNTYADKTIYNFTEMTRNIGTFTAAGVDLDKSVTSIKGIANLAAVSGSTSQQASTAMYQLSQALAAGKVQLMDWNSVVNAGMGGQVFQDALKRTAKHMGTDVDAMIKKYGSFRESLTKGEWLTSEVLTETLTQLSGAYSEADLIAQGYTKEQAKQIVELADTAVSAATEVKTFTQLMDTLKEAAQSGWTQTWEILIGDFEEAKALWTNVSNVFGGFINSMSESRNSMLEGWADLGGRKVLIEGISNAFDNLVSILKPIRDAFREIFPPITSKQLFEFTEGFKKLTERFKIGKDTAEGIKNTFKGLFSVVKLGMTIFTGLVKGVAKLVGALFPVGGGVLSVTGSLGEFVSKITEAVSKLNIFETVFGFLAKLIAPVGKAIGDALNGISKGVDKMGGLIGICKKIGEAIGWVFDKVSSVVSSFLSGGQITSALDIVNGGLLAGVLIGIRKFLKGVIDAIGEGGGLFDNIKDTLDAVRGSLEAWQQNLQASTLLKIAAAIGILAVSLKIISGIDSNKLGTSLGAIAALFTELLASMFLFNKLGGASKDARRSTGLMIGMSVAVLILASALKKLSDLNWEQLAKGLVGVGVLMAELALFLNNAKFGKKAISNGIGMIALAAAIKILASAVGDFGSMKWEEIGKGLVAIGALLGELALFTKLTGDAKKTISTGIAMIALATAMEILASALQGFGSMKWEEIGKGLVAMAGALAAITIAVNLMPKNMVGMGVGLIFIATAMIELSSALSSMGSMSWTEIAKGLTVMAGALAAITLAVNFMPKNMIGIGVGLIAIATSMVILANALSSMGGMSWEEIGKGLVALAGSLTIIAVAIQFMQSALPGAAALLVISTALAILAPVLKTLGSMSWENIGKGLVALAGAFAVLGVAALVLTPIVPTILLLGVAIAAIGVGCLAAGAGILALSAGLAALAVSGTAGAAALITIITSLLNLIPTVALAIGAAIVAIVVAIGNSAGAIMTAVTQILVAILQAITNIIPQLMTLISTILIGICGVITQVAPVIVETILGVLLMLLEKLGTYVPKFVDAGVEIITGFLDGVARNVGKIVKSAVKIVTNFLNAIGEETPKIVDAGFEMIIDFINGLADSIEKNTPKLVNAMDRLMDAIIDAGIEVLTGSMGSFLSNGKKLITKLAEGISNTVSKVTSAAKEICTKCVNAIKNKASSFISAGKDLIGGFVKGIKEKISAAADAAASVGKKALNSIKKALGINSPSKEFATVGRDSDRGLIFGLKALAGKVASTAKNVGTTALDSMKRSLSGIANVIDLGIDSQPTIRPVLDLSDVSAGAGAINGMFNMTPSIGVMSNLRAISSMMNENQNGNDDVVSAIKRLGTKLDNVSGDTYIVDGVTYDDGSNVVDAVQTLVRAAKIERRR